MTSRLKWTDIDHGKGQEDRRKTTGLTEQGHHRGEAGLCRAGRRSGVSREAQAAAPRRHAVASAREFAVVLRERQATGRHRRGGKSRIYLGDPDMKQITLPYTPRRWAEPFHASTSRFLAMILHR